MKVKCKKLKLNEIELESLGDSYHTGWEELELEVGKEYLVYSLSYSKNNLWVYLIFSERWYLISTPIYYFEIIDTKIPNIWEIEYKNNKLHIAPRSFFRKFYYDDLAECIPEILEDFKEKRKLIENDSYGA